MAKKPHTTTDKETKRPTVAESEKAQHKAKKDARKERGDKREHIPKPNPDVEGPKVGQVPPATPVGMQTPHNAPPPELGATPPTEPPKPPKAA